MLKYLLICILAAQGIWSNPVPPQGDVASHIVIVTPQAQVHLEPALKYDGSATFIHHLSPLARFSGPHDETIVYVPASGVGPAIPFETISAAGRAGGANSAFPQRPAAETKQGQQIMQGIENIQAAIASGAAMYIPMLSDAAQAAAAAASSASGSFFPPGGSTNKDEKLKPEFEAKPLLAPETRRYYAFAPSLPHLLDFVHAPVYVGPLSAIRARSIQTDEAPVAALPLTEGNKPEALPLKTAPQQTISENAAEPEKKEDFGRFLEANALKEEIKEELLEENNKRENLKTEQEPAASNNIAEAQPQALAIASETELAQAQPKAVAAVVHEGQDNVPVAAAVPQDAGITHDEVPKSKVA